VQAPNGGDMTPEHYHAYHEAAHAVAMFRLGFGVRHLTIEPRDGLTGLCLPQRAPEFGDHESTAGRAAIERYAMALHAGNAAERHLRPDHADTLARVDHKNVHFMLQWIEDDTAVEFAWCSYLWQRAYTFIADARQWRLVRKVADALLQGPPTLTASAAMRLLTDSAAALEHDPTMPDFQLLGEPPVQVRSPWHAEWYSGKPETPFPRYELLMATALQAQETRRGEQRPPATELPGLDVFTPYTAHVLQRVGIAGVADLGRWTREHLASLRGVGPKTLRELGEVAARYGISLNAERPRRRSRVRSAASESDEERR